MINVLGYMRWFREPDLRTFPWLAERSELFRELGLAGRARPDGFAFAIGAYYDTLQSANRLDRAFQLLDDLDVTDIAFLAKRAVSPADRP